MAKRDSNIVEIKLERVGKKYLHSPFNTNITHIPGHPVSISQELAPLSNDQNTADYQLISSFGKMYVGESFTSCVKVANISEGAILEPVSIICQLKYTGAKTFPMLFQTDIPKLNPSQVKRFAFSIMVSQADVYFLSFQIRFSVRELADPVTFGKLFKFEAKMPFEMKHRAVKGESGLFLEIRLTNCTIYPMNLESADFLPGPDLSVLSLHDSPSSRVFNNADTRAYLYQLVENKPLPSQVELGNFVLAWSNNTGDAGNIAFQSLPYSAKLEKILQVTIEDAPSGFQLEIPVAVTFRFTNLSTNFFIEELKIQLDNSLMRNLVLTPLEGLEIGRIGPKESKFLKFCLFPKVPGIHKLEGMRVFSANKSWDYESCSIFIQG